MPYFALDPTLEADSIPVAELSLCAVRLVRDANYPWLLLVPQQQGLAEIIDLDELDRGLLMREITKACEALKATVPCDKLNIAALGNSVRQLHVHVIARLHDDAAWPKPVWGAAPPQTYAEGEAEALAARLAEHLN